MGVLFALTIIGLWFANCTYALLFLEVSILEWSFWLSLWFQVFLSVGLFITAHDAMHGTIHRNKKINTIIGNVACFLFAALSFRRLYQNHHIHHQHPTSLSDPDFSNSQNIVVWYARFMWHYTTLRQLITMSILFNIIDIFFEQEKVWMFWALPSLIASFQLFYFGTFRPHRHPHYDVSSPHFARSLSGRSLVNHTFAFLSCYFFGYHLEHHSRPDIPWWRLYRLKNMSNASERTQSITSSRATPTD